MASNFASQAHLLIPVMHCHLSGSSSQKIAISKSLSSQKLFIVPAEEADDECIILEDFLAMLDIRINSEHAYREEIAQLKNNICEEFNKLCYGVIDEDFIKFVRDQRQMIIDAVIDGTKVENKMIAEKFYNDMMNGFEEEALNLCKFGDIFYAVLLEPIRNPFPIEALNQLMNFMEELGKDKSKQGIEMITIKFIDYIKDYLKEKEIKENEFESSEKLEIVLEEIAKKRQICNIEIHDLPKCIEIIKKFEKKCIGKVKVVNSTKLFLEKGLQLNYEALKLEGKIQATEVDKVFDKVQKRTKVLEIEIGKNMDFEKLGKYLLKLKWLTCLNLDIKQNNISNEGAKAVSAALKGLKNLLSLTLNLEGNDIEDEGAKAISIALEELKNLSALTLELLDNNIEVEGSIAISAAIGQLKNISTLYLSFSDSNIGDKGAVAISSALKQLKNISNLTLVLENSSIGKEGAKAISSAMKELNNISTLVLGIGENDIGDEGAMAISTTLKDLKQISTLILNIVEINIDDEEIIAGIRELERIHPDWMILSQ